MSQNASTSARHRLPFWATVGLAAIFTLTSLAGLIWAERLYPGLDAQLAFLPLDLFNLLAISPPTIVLLMAIREGRSMALATWSGFTLYTLYNGIAHLWAMPLSPAMAPWALVTVASGYLTAAVLLTIDHERLRRRLGYKLHARLAGGLLVVLGALFSVYALVEMIRGSLSPATVTTIDSMLWLTDVAVSPACVIAGVAIWRREPLGFALGPGALVLFAALFLGLPAVEVFRAITTTASMDVATLGVGLVGGILSMAALTFKPKGEPGA